VHVLWHAMVIAGGCASDGAVMWEWVDVAGGGCVSNRGDK
jgi:hypothetical protein